jgi:Mg2+/Co2+ transporter CorB
VIPSTAVLGVVAVAGLVVLSAFFSSSETAIFTLSEEWLAAQADSTDPDVSTLVALRRDPHRLLVTILVGNNVVNVAVASITTVLLIDVLPAGPAVSVATVLASVVVLVFGEIVPKSYGLGRAESWATRVARPLSLVERLLSPLVFVFDRLTRGLTAVVGGDPDVEEQYLDEDDPAV